MTDLAPTLFPGTVPLLLSLPHAATAIPAALRSAYTERACGVEDTDWHLPRLYAFAQELGASVLVPAVSRYVIDLNRPADNAPMYPGASNTELCPTRFFTGEPLYREGCAPGAAAQHERLQRYWQPYHQALAAELQRLRALHGYALLWDGHSIRSQIPWLFEGTLPDLNLGTAGGASAHPRIAQALMDCIAQHAPTTSRVLNGRFKGGYITRHYGAPEQGIHAVQLEMCQHLYMQEQAPFAYDDAGAARVQPLLRALLHTALDTAKELYV
ncbi:MAG: N-formylglutamate deformylase [Rhodoferax sp.]